MDVRCNRYRTGYRDALPERGGDARDVHWAEGAKHFKALSPGTLMTFPENPPGWNMWLVKPSSN
jgi:hypothetical protein